MAVTLSINNQQVVVPAGSTILEAARAAGIRIPTLCHHPDLSNVGSCRICVVSVAKMKGLQAACTTPVAEGMVVDTESREVRDARRVVLQLLLSSHPNDCIKCEANGDCELQDLVYEYNVPWPEFDGMRHNYPIDPDPNPFIFIDRNKCILCSRCVRACAEIQNRDVWTIANRGFETKLVAGLDRFLLESGCESCGQCVAYCPVGALYDKMSLGLGRVNQVTKVRTTCSYCGVGCNFDLNVRDGRIIRVTSAHDAPVNGMALCVKGRYGYDYVHHPDRLTKPLVRKYLLQDQKTDDGRPTTESGHPGRRSSVSGRDDFVEVDWDVALDIVAREFTRIKQESGADALAIMTSAKCTNEENYLANKLARQVIGTNNIDHCARL